MSAGAGEDFMVEEAPSMVVRGDPVLDFEVYGMFIVEGFAVEYRLDRLCVICKYNMPDSFPLSQIYQKLYQIMETV